MPERRYKASNAPKHPTKFDTVAQDLLIRANGLLMPIKAQAGLVGIGVQTLWDWIHRAQHDLEKSETEGVPLSDYASWYQKYMAAKSVKAMSILETWHEQATDKDNRQAWLAGATALERAYPEDFARRQAVQVQQDTTVTFKVVRTDRWLEVNSATGNVIDSQFVEEDEMAALPAPEHNA